VHLNRNALNIDLRCQM